MKFFKYQFTSEFPDSPNKENGGHLPITKIGYFLNHDLFLHKLHSWNKSSYRYYLTAENAIANATEKSIEYDIVDEDNLPIGNNCVAWISEFECVTIKIS